MVDGSSWKEGLANDADYDRVVAHAGKTIWHADQKGLPKKLHQGRLSLQATKKNTDAMVERVGQMDNSHYAEAVAAAEAALLASDITIVEAKLIQNVSRDTRTPLVSRVAIVQVEVDRVHDSKEMKSSMIVPSIWLRALAFLRTA